MVMPFQMMDMVEVPIEATLEISAENVLEAVQAIFTIRDHIHDKAAKTSKWAQEWEADNFDRWHQWR